MTRKKSSLSGKARKRKFAKDIIFIPAKRHVAYVNGEGKLQDLRKRTKKTTAKRKASLNGPSGTFRPTDRQLCNLRPAHLKAIVESHRKKGDRIIGLNRKPICAKRKK